MANLLPRDSSTYKVRDLEIIVWTELRVPPSEELDTHQWTGHFQPLVQASGHHTSLWARIRERPNIVLLVTLWKSQADLRNFTVSPCAQIFWENLAGRGVSRLASHETIYRDNWFTSLQHSFIQLFWVYFPAPVDEAQLARISDPKKRGLRPPATGPGIPLSHRPARHIPAQEWATQTEFLHDQEVQLMLWPHFWGDEKKAEWRNGPTFLMIPGTACVMGTQTRMEAFRTLLEELGSIEWKEEFCEFEQLPRV
ncbi:uncharacterized protein N7482_006496 [Penicillium canariense]|uniref:ABM domain-containing protein n=1 Tax=Penicillium canariense TaxID=189055 RepID=A0A9W9HXY3_9EURO|nr:uncharacterized protein N7482_006496 [Penicillium canariense]KAJ5159492.1 hypothetical protein N7482_006496 [Penicillium canariense]